MDFSAKLKIDFGGGQPAHYDVDFSLAAPTDDDAPIVGLKAVQTMAVDVLGAMTEPEQQRLKDEALKYSIDNGLWPL